MRITKQKDSIFRHRKDGSKIYYYLYNEYEIHYGELDPGIIQPWHHHMLMNESLYIISGKVKLHYLEKGVKKEIIVEPGDIIEVENTPHTFSNPYKITCKMIGFRFIPIKKKTQHIIKKDKILHPELD